MLLRISRPVPVSRATYVKEGIFYGVPVFVLASNGSSAGLNHIPFHRFSVSG